MDNFNIITEKDKGDISYGACIGATAMTGAAVGRLVGLQGLLAGAAVGVAVGLITCRHLKEPIKQKLFSGTGRLTDQELAQALRAVRLETGVATKADAMYLLSAARNADRTSNAPMSGYRSQGGLSPRSAARILLNQRA